MILFSFFSIDRRNLWWIYTTWYCCRGRWEFRCTFREKQHVNNKKQQHQKTTTTCCTQGENQYACHANFSLKHFPLHQDDETTKKPKTKYQKKKTQVIQKKNKTHKKISSMIDQKRQRRYKKENWKLLTFSITINL